MSRWRSIWLVARREIIERGRSRAFLISLILTVAIIAGGILLPSIVGGGPGMSRLGIVGTPAPGFANNLTAVGTQTQLRIATEDVADVATAEALLEAETLDAVLAVPADGSAPSVIVKERGNERLVQTVSSALAAARAREMLENAGVDPGELAAAAAPPTVRMSEMTNARLRPRSMISRRATSQIERQRLMSRPPP